MRTNPLIALPRSARRLPRMAPDMSRLPTGRIVTLADDVVTRLYDTGEEHLQPVILLHGMAATGMLNWYQTFQRLHGEYRLIAYDQRHHGMGHTGNFDFQTLSEDVLRVADHLELEQPVVGGYSMGGIVAQLAARPDPSRLGGLVLAATGTGAQRNALEKADFACEEFRQKLVQAGMLQGAELRTTLPKALDDHRFAWDTAKENLHIVGV